MQKINQMSAHSLSVLEDSVAALLRRDYQLADQTVDRTHKIYDLENNILEMIERDANLAHAGSIRLVIEDIRRTAEYASDIAETAINETIDEIISKDQPSDELEEQKKRVGKETGRHHEHHE